MTETFIIAILAPAATIIVCLINNHFLQERNKQQRIETVELISYKLDQLTKKVELHNNAVERLYAVEQQLKIDEQKIRVCEHRIEDLEDTASR